MNKSDETMDKEETDDFERNLMILIKEFKPEYVDWEKIGEHMEKICEKIIETGEIYDNT